MNELRNTRGSSCPCGNAPQGAFRTSWRRSDADLSCRACRIRESQTRTQRESGENCTACRIDTTPVCNDCSEGISEENLLREKSLAMVYAPSQKFEGVCEPQKALLRGTAFHGLDTPFYGDRRY